MQKEGKIRHIGLSEVSVEEIEKVEKLATIVSVQNLYNFSNRKSEPVLKYCETNSLGFIPWFPVAAGKLTKPGGKLDQIGQKYNATVAQVALAWLLQRSPVILPIPGTSSVEHLEENCAASELKLTEEDISAIGG
jgi:aryl-alcohol dehydrogenase-like predicted oxidoreductase